MDSKRAWVQIYTGDGKGKTTAALGLALRAWSAGLEVRIVQFMKPDGCSAEQQFFRRLPERLQFAAFGVSGFCRVEQQPTPEQRQTAAAALEQARGWLAPDCDLLVLDELLNAVHFGLVELPAALSLLDARPLGTELVLTGRYAPPELLARADLITEMRAVRHYAEQGVHARRGIEY